MPRIDKILECEEGYTHPALWGTRAPSWGFVRPCNTAIVLPVSPKLNDFMDELYHRGHNARCDSLFNLFVLWAAQSFDESKSTNALRHLEDAAKRGDERAFLCTLDQTDWLNKSAEDYVYAIQLALQAGAHLAARRIANDGLSQYPQNATLQKYARGLAPPVVVARNLPANPTLRANREWLKTHSEEYRGQWVAVRNGELLGAASSLKELTERIDRTNTLFTRVR
jgi:hypothetical protein